MVKCLIHNAKIKGISSVVPKTELSLLDMPDLYNGNQKKIKRVIESSGFLKRRVTDKETTTADLCETAAKDLIKNLNIDVSTIDGIIFSSYTPDYLMPATSYVLHHKLGLSEDCICMDIPQACSGYVLGLYQASMMVNSGCKRILLLVGDSFSKFTDMFKDNSAPVFGDAGSATIVEYDETAEPMYFNIKSDGQKHESLICKNGGFRHPASKEDFYEDGEYQYLAKMQGAEIFNFTIEKVPESISETLEYAKTAKDDVDWFILHQANKFILTNIAQTLDVDTAKMPMENISKYGNQCGASIPNTISENISEIVSKEKQKLLISGFGVGLSWASAVLTLDNIYCSKVLEYGE
ncbi:MAG: ketoacyl-ACP synthase III [Candidatus Gastranaerophilales bacterium]|nr:ketoacyl-ACP synthase III [Candidatus Gastranaerophilales bacterium]